MINRTFTASQTSFKNVYTIFDLLNVVSLYNGTDDFPAAYLLTPKILFQLRTSSTWPTTSPSPPTPRPVRSSLPKLSARSMVTSRARARAS